MDNFKNKTIFWWDVAEYEAKFEELKKIKYYPKLDILTVLEMFKIIEAYNENRDYLLKNIDNEELESVISDFKKSIGVFVSGLLENDIVNYFKSIFKTNSSKTNFYFEEIFIRFFEYYKLGNKLTELKFKNLVFELQIPVKIFLKTKYWNNSFKCVIKEIFLSDSTNIEILLLHFSNNNNNYYFPDNITKEEYYKLATDYVNNVEMIGDRTYTPNYSYLQLMEKGIKGIEQYFCIDPKLKIRISDEIERQTSELFKHGQSFVQDIVIHTNPDEYSSSKANEEIKGIVEVEFIKKASNIETLLTYIKYLDHLFTNNGLLNLLSFPNSESSVFLNMLGMKSKNHYFENFYWECKQSIILQEFYILKNCIKKEKNLELEELVDYFFKVYSSKEFEIDWLPLEISKDDKLKNRTKINFTIEESIRKQWKLLIEEGEIDNRLYNFETTPSFYSLKSYLPNKYIYPTSSETDRIIQLLFSDQTMLGYINKDKNESNFISLISNHKVLYSEFNSFSLSDIDFLIEKEIISREKNDLITLTSYQDSQLLIFGLLWRYGVVNQYNLYDLKHIVNTSLLKRVIQDMEEKNIIKFESTLLSRPESDFLNYLLNNSRYDNAKALRNKYEHDFVSNNENEYYNDYLYSVIVLFFYVIKINEEFHFNSLLQEKEGAWSTLL
ncbi:hypothetical protein ACFX18_09410 [Lactococcus garvieae]|uniref:hypothetical protein n=1 Tax=Lactococcus garvieae TaxID=1363 RepID=UPI003D17BDF5